MGHIRLLTKYRIQETKLKKQETKKKIMIDDNLS